MASEFVGCASTLVLQFPDEVYRSSGESVVLPELLKSVDVPKVRCVQFIRNGLVRVTFDDTASCDAALSSGVVFRGARLPVSSVSARSRLVYVRDLPAEVPESFVESTLSSYGTVHTVTAMEHTGYPGLLNGTRLVRIVLEKDIPSSLHISGFECRVWYRGQPQACIICHSYRHRVRECPLNGLCRRCHKAGHVARECREPRRLSTVPSEPLSSLVSPEEDSSEADVDFVPVDESESASSIAENEELLVSGDESVLAEETVRDLPPRVSVPVSTPVSPSTTSKRPLSPTATSAPLPKCSTVSVPSIVPPVKPRASSNKSPSISSDSSVSPRNVKSNASSVKSSATPIVKPSAVRQTASSEQSFKVKSKTTPTVKQSDVKQIASSEQTSRVSSEPIDDKSNVTQDSPVAKSHVKQTVPPEQLSTIASEPFKDDPLTQSYFSTNCPTGRDARPPYVTSFALIFKDPASPLGASRIDCGPLTKDVIMDKIFFDYDRFVYYVHRGISRATATVLDDVPLCETLPRLRRGPRTKFPGEQ